MEIHAIDVKAINQCHVEQYLNLQSRTSLRLQVLQVLELMLHQESLQMHLDLIDQGCYVLCEQ